MEEIFHPQRPEDNHHQRKTMKIGEGNTIEYLQQLRGGDCGIIAFLDTASFLDKDGKLPMNVEDARNKIVGYRRRDLQAGRSQNNPEEIGDPNSELDNRDFVNIFSSLYNVSAEQDDVLTIDHTEDMEITREKISLALEYLDTYESGVCATNFGRHARVIVKDLSGGEDYWLIDPMPSSGETVYQVKSRTEIVDLFSRLALHRSGGENFLFFIRKPETR